MGRLGPPPLPPLPLLAAALQGRGKWQKKSPRPKDPELGVFPWGILFPPVCPTPLSPCLTVGGRADRPLFPSPSPQVGVVGVGAWVGRGVGESGVCGPMDGHPVPLPVKVTNPNGDRAPPLPPPRCAQAWGGVLGGRTLQPNFSRGPPLRVMACGICGPNCVKGSPPRGVVCMWGGVLVCSLRMGASQTRGIINVTAPRVHEVGGHRGPDHALVYPPPPLCPEACVGGFSVSTPPPWGKQGFLLGFEHSVLTRRCALGRSKSLRPTNNFFPVITPLLQWRGVGGVSP